MCSVAESSKKDKRSLPKVGDHQEKRGRKRNSKQIKIDAA